MLEAIIKRYESIRELIVMAAVGLKPQAQVTKSAKAD
jgi:hypothetical protein